MKAVANLYYTSKAAVVFNLPCASGMSFFSFDFYNVQT